ncbi:MAG: TraB/GumN family protein, partial [Planctomycetota bacterium]
MNDIEGELSARVKHILLGQADVFLVGTAHVSRESVEDVKNTIEHVRPDCICVELCRGRYEAMTRKDVWKKMNIFKILKERKSALLLAQLVMGAFYKKLGEKFGVQPGAEMLEGIKQAEKTNAKLVLADRAIEITLKRVWGYLGFWDKMKLFSHLIVSLFAGEKIDEELIEQMKKHDQLESIMGEFAEKFPEIKKRLIDERDIYLAQKIRSAPGEKKVAVVGAGHVAGIAEHIKQDEPIAELEEIPPKSIWPKLLKWAIPAAIVLLFVAGFFKGGKEHSIQSVWIWILVNGILSALGAAIALAHPLTIISAFIAAPLTSLNPLMAAGWVASTAEGYEVFERLLGKSCDKDITGSCIGQFREQLWHIYCDSMDSCKVAVRIWLDLCLQVLQNSSYKSFANSVSGDVLVIFTSANLPA